MSKQHHPGFLRIVEAAKTQVRETTVEEVRTRLVRGDSSFVLVDVREDSEWSAGHIQGAIHLGKGVIERDIEGEIPEKDREIILYCGGGFRSALAARSLQEMGYTRVVSMDGGWRVWKEKGYPVE